MTVSKPAENAGINVAGYPVGKRLSDKPKKVVGHSI
jgi:hypothetical protein